MENTPKIALSGKKYAGKSTLAALLAEHFEVPVGSFAAALKRSAAALGFEAEGTSKDVLLLQDLGDFLRKRDPSYFITRFAQQHPQLQRGLIIDDVRFRNEADWCRQHGFFLIRLAADSYTRYKQGSALLGAPADFITSTHPSETELDDYAHFDLVLGGNLSLEETCALVLHILVLREA